MLRTHTCNELTAHNLGAAVTLSGWVQSRRDHGGLIFIDLRDRYGITQIVFRPEEYAEAFAVGDSVRSEYVIQVKGAVSKRPAEMINKHLPTGEIEVIVHEIKILNTAKTPPFEVESPAEAEQDVNEERRMTYRYIDLRRPRMKRNMTARHEAIRFIRNFLADRGFLEVETPLLTKSTPEGARDYLVPSRVHRGRFYALPQSPQQYKQLLMVGGLDRYFQIAKCLRDEDSRGDRQAEFSQLDLEMSFVERDDVLDLLEVLATSLVEYFKEKKFITKSILSKPFPRLSYDEAVLRYGIDKPDLRFGLEITDITELVRNCGFSVFADAVAKGGVVRALNAPGAGETLSRSHIDELTELAKTHHAKGLAYIKVKDGGELDSPIVKFLGDECARRIVQALSADTGKVKAGDIIFFGADHHLIVEESLAHVRLDLARRLGLIDPNVLAFSFTLDFPLFEPEYVNRHPVPMHHMFTMPRKEDLSLLDTDPLKVKSWQYDFVFNGNETAGGSIRIHVPELQQKIFELIGFSKEQQKDFIHMLEAFQYGAPPHGGFALGIDRFLMLLLDEPNIREVMAFPKTGDARDLTVGAPSTVEQQQLRDLGIRVIME
ncbi:aspartate--tRNA ligase [Candidatus Uhrbacteria bacterium]|nr:aspartate--tRNA ligase [Candidatus Uhrbacteria bacterium]